MALSRKTTANPRFNKMNYQHFIKNMALSRKTTVNARLKSSVYKIVIQIYCQNENIFQACSSMLILLLHQNPKAGLRLTLRFCVSEQRGSTWMPAHSRPSYRRLNAGVEHALLEKLTFFFRTQALFSKTQTHRSPIRHRIKAQTKRRQSHIKRWQKLKTQGRHVAG